MKSCAIVTFEFIVNSILLRCFKMDLTTHRPDISNSVHHSGDFSITSENYVSPNLANAAGPRAAKSVFSIRSIVEESKNGISSSCGKLKTQTCFKTAD